MSLSRDLDWYTNKWGARFVGGFSDESQRFLWLHVNMSQIVKPQWLSCANEPLCSASLIFNFRQHIPLKEIIKEMLPGGLSFILHTVWVTAVKGGHLWHKIQNSRWERGLESCITATANQKYFSYTFIFQGTDRTIGVKRRWGSKRTPWRSSQGCKKTMSLIDTYKTYNTWCSAFSHHNTAFLSS